MLLDEAKSLLSSRSNWTVNELRGIANQFSALTKPGTTTIIYGGMIQPASGPSFHSNVLGNALYDSDRSRFSIIDQTDRAKLLNSDEFKLALGQAIPDATLAEGYNSGILAPDGQPSFFGQASKEFAGSANGKVVAIGPAADLDRIMAQIELPTMLDNLADPAKPHITSVNGFSASELLNWRAQAALEGGADYAKLQILRTVAGSSAADIYANITVSAEGPTKFNITKGYYDINGLPEPLNPYPKTSEGSLISRINPYGGASYIEQADRLLLAAKLGHAVNAAGRTLGFLGIMYTAYQIDQALKAGHPEEAKAIAVEAAGGWAAGAAAAFLAAEFLAPVNAVPVIGQGLYVVGVAATGVAAGLGGGALTRKIYTGFNDLLNQPTGQLLNGYTYTTTPLPTEGDWYINPSENGEIVVIGWKKRAGEIDLSQAQFFQTIFSPKTVEGIFAEKNMQSLAAALNDGPGIVFGPSAPKNLSEAIGKAASSGKKVVLIERDGQIQPAILEQGRALDLSKVRNIGHFEPQDTDQVIKFVSSDGNYSAIHDGDLILIDVPNEPLKIYNPKSPIGFQFADAGSILGSVIGNRLADGNALTGVLASAALMTVGDTLGKVLDIEIFSSSTQEGERLGQVIDHLGDEFLNNLVSAGVGAISSYLTAELVNALGVNGFAGELANSAAGGYVSAIITNLPQLLNQTKSLSDVLGAVNVGNIIGSFLGSKLANEVHSFDTVGGQIGSAVGAALGTAAALSTALGLVAAAPGTTAALAQLGALAGPVGALAGAFVGFLLGGLIGSLFGGTPRSGADVVWDSATGAFTVANVYSKQGGSKKAARSMANAVADTYNGVLSAVGGTLLNPEAVQAGNYGMRKKSFVYRPVSSRDKEAITQRFSGKKGAEKLIGYGIYQGLSDPDFQIAGGDIYAKRALTNTFALGGLDPLDFDASVLMGNLASAQSYERYLANSTAVNALVAAEPQAVFAIETAITLARASELGLTRRAASDWVGGFNFLMNQAGTGPANVSFGFDYDPYSDKISRLIGVGGYVLGDAIDVAGQDVIEGGAGADTISLVNNQIADVRGLTVNGKLQNDIAATGSDFAAASGMLSFASGDLRKSFTISGIANDGVAEGAESLLAKLSAASAMTIMGGAATVTIRDAGATPPQLLVGRSFAAEGDYAVFRVSLSKALTAGTTVAVGLALADGGAAGAGVDYGASAFQVSTDGNSWTTATSATFTSTLSTVYVRTLTRTDNSANPAYVPGNGQPQTLGIEGNEDFTLTATVTAGAAYVANTSASGKGTIVDASVTTLPLVWVDDVVVDEAAGSATVTVSRSRSGAVGTVGYATADRRALGIDIAATVDAGDGNDRVDASDRGDNVFGGVGNDTIVGGKLDDWLFGGDGNDRLFAGRVTTVDFLDSDAAATAAALAADGGNGNLLDGGAGDDRIYGTAGSDWIKGGDGADMLQGGQGGDILDGGAGNDQGASGAAGLLGGGGTDQYIFGYGSGLDVIFDDATQGAAPGATADSIAAQIAGLNAGTITRNWAGGGNFLVDGSVKGGEDAIVFGADVTMGNVILQRSGTSGAPGMDLIIKLVTPGAGVWNGVDQLTVKDWFESTRRVEWLRFASGEEIRIADMTSFKLGTSGPDIMIGTNAADFIYGGDGNDKIYGLAGDDYGVGGAGNDLVSGDDDNDWVLGGSDDDVVLGGKGNDVVFGDDGDDRLYGSAGVDILAGGKGNDEVIGGLGDDIFRYSRGDGQDVIFDELVTGVNGSGWELVWDTGAYVNGYSFDNVTKKVSKAGVDYFDGVNWLGRYNYEEAASGTGVKKLWRYVPPTTGSTVAASNLAGSGSDTLEFGVGIDAKDLMFRNNGGSLEIAITKADLPTTSFDSVTDRVTIKDWFVSGAGIENFQFVNTGKTTVNNVTFVGGTDGSDTITTTVAGVWVTGGAGDDTITSGVNGMDTLSGNSGNDYIRGEAYADILFGGDGDDTLDGGQHNDILIGGAGIDIASYAASPNVAIIAFLSASQFNMNNQAAGDVYESIEGLTGGPSGDQLYGDTGDNILNGGAWGDRLFGGAGDDTYVVDIMTSADLIDDRPFSIQEVVDVAGNLNTANFSFDWALLSPTPNAQGLYSYRLIIKHIATNQVVYDSTTAPLNYASNTQPLPPSSAWSLSWLNAGRTGLGPAGQTLNQAVTPVFDTTDGGNDVLEFGSGFSFSNLAITRGGTGNADLIFTNGTATETIKGQFTAASAIETLQFYDGLSLSLSSILIASGTGTFNGTANDDLLVGRNTTADDLDGGLGDDVLSGQSGNDTLKGGAGNDVLEGGLGADVFDGGTDSQTLGATPDDGNGDYGDTIRYIASTAAVSVNLATRAITGAAGSDGNGDTIVADANGVSTIEHVKGSEGHGDTLTGDARHNRLFGLGGNDTILGGAGNDVLDGGDGVDKLWGEDGDDNFDAGTGDDIDVRGGNGNDVIELNDGNDVAYGDAGADRLTGSDGNDLLWGGSENDKLIGGDGADTLHGETGNDELTGGTGNDALYGEDGNDVLAGEGGDDALAGGLGDDSYSIQAGSGSDTIIDASGTNRIAFTDVSYDRLWLTRSGNDLRISVIGDNSLVIVKDYYAGTGATLMREVATTTHSLFLSYAAPLITAMSNASASAPAAMPDNIRALFANLWWAGGKAAPLVADEARTMGEKSEPSVSSTITGSAGAIDHDGNIPATGAYALSQPAAHGAVTLDPNSGAWSYTPTTYYNGADSFSVQVTDADNQAAVKTVTVTVTPVNSRPLALTRTSGITALNEQDHPISTATRPAIDLGLLSVDDPDNRNANALSTPVLTDPIGYGFAVSDPRFSVGADRHLYLNANAAVDFEAGNTITVNVTATDPGGLAMSAPTSFTFTVVDKDDYFYGTTGAETINGQSGRDYIYGYAGNDTINGNAGSDYIDAEAGNDLIDAGTGVDTVFGGFGNDTIKGGDGDDVLSGDGDNDSITGGLGIDRLDGGAGNDILFGDDGDDKDVAGTTGVVEGLYGGAGDDTLIGGLGADMLDGGANIDTASYEYLSQSVLATAGLTADLGTAANNTGAAAGDIYSGIENLRGTGQADTLRGDINANTLYGGAGNDALYARAGDDLIYGEDGNDSIYGEDGHDALLGDAGADSLEGGEGNDSLTGGAGTDVLLGGNGNDLLWGGTENDTLIGGAGDDTYIIKRGDGDDTIDQTGAPTTDNDVLGFQAGTVAGQTQSVENKHLWFYKVGNDVWIQVLGTAGVDARAKLLSFVTNDADGVANVNTVIAGQTQTTTVGLAVNDLADLMAAVEAQRARPTTAAQFDALYNDATLLIGGLTFKSKFDDLWVANAAPNILAPAPQTINEDQYTSTPQNLSVRIWDDNTNAAGITTSLRTLRTDGLGVDSTLLTNLALGTPDVNGYRTLTYQTQNNASGAVDIEIYAKDAGGRERTAIFRVTVNPVADPAAVSSTTNTGGSAGPGGIPLLISAATTDPSETLDLIQIQNVAPHARLSAGTQLNATTWQLAPGQLSGLKLYVDDLDRSEDFTVQVSAHTVDGPSNVWSTPVNLNVAVNARPNNNIATASGLHISEFAGNGAIATFTASDPDGDMPAFYLVSGGPMFSINSSTGVLSLDQAGSLNYEAAQSYAITVRAQDPQGLSRDANFTVWVDDVNERPSFAQTSYGGLSINENAGPTSIVQVSASDPDGGANGGRYYYFSANGTTVSGPDGTYNRSSYSPDGRFYIDPNNGWISSTGAIDRETAGSSLSYTLLVMDGTAAPRVNSAGIAIAVNDLNEAPTVNAGQSFNIYEEAYGPVGQVASFGQVIANDTDVLASNRDLRYFIVGGDPNGNFAFDAGGNLYAVKRMDWEDLNQPRSYTISVIARDQAGNGLSSNPVNVTVNLNPINDAPEVYGLDGTVKTSAPIIYSNASWIPGSYYYGFKNISVYDPEGTSAFNYEIVDINVNNNVGGPGSPLMSKAQLQVNGSFVGTSYYGSVRPTVAGYGLGWFKVKVTDSGGAYSFLNFTVYWNNVPPVPPVALDLDGDGIELVSLADSSTFFDFNDDGIADRTGWVAADDGLLALDIDDSGFIDRKEEVSFAGANGSATDLEGLRDYDSNQNGMLDAGDDRYADFRVWQDSNQDGISQASELTTLTGRDIAAINLTINPTGQSYEDAEDNVIYATTEYVRGDGTTGQVGDVFLAYFPTPPLATPITLDLDGDGLDVVSLAVSHIYYDMDGDGRRERTGWIGSGDGLLVLDRDHNGRIEGISEISFKEDLAGAMTDLEGLAAFDSNHDGLFSADDARFGEFQIWQDRNQNGKSEAGELVSLAQAGVSIVNLTRTPNNAAPVAGDNQLFNTAEFVRADGSKGTVGDYGFAYSATETAPAEQSFTRKAKHFRIDAAGGSLFVRPANVKAVTDGTAGKLAGATLLSFKGKRYGLASPIILDLDGDGIEMRSIKKAKAAFDMDGDGRADNTGWVGKGDALLALDRNGNGTIDDIHELSFLGDKEGAVSDLDGLSAFDSNHDGKFDANDTRFGEFKLWKDANGNGVSEAGELVGLSDAGISEIGLARHAVDGSVKIGSNVVVATAAFKRSDGSVGTVGDVALAYRPTPEPTPKALPFGGAFNSSALEAAITAFEQRGAGQHSQDLTAMAANDTEGQASLNRFVEQMAAFGGGSGAASLEAVVRDATANRLELLTAARG